MPRAARPFVAARLMTVSAALTVDGYAFSKFGDTITAYGYAGSTLAETRGTFDATAYPLWGSQYAYTTSGTTARSIVLTDSAATVGDGSLLFVGDDAKLVCWDVEGNTSHVRTAATGYHVGGAVFDSGYAYWTEVENVAHGGGRYFYVRLMRGRADFTGVSTLATREMDGTSNDGTGADAYRLRRTDSGCWVIARLLMGEVDYTLDVWLSDAGATAEQSAAANATEGTPRANGDAVFGSLPYFQEAATGTETALYPSASVGGDESSNLVGSTYQSYGASGGISYRWSTAGDPDATAADSTVTLDNAEDVYFLASE